MKVHSLGHASYLLEEGNVKILFDPVFFRLSETGFTCAEGTEANEGLLLKQSIDAIFISHFHEDHFCLKTLSQFDRNLRIYVFSPTLVEINDLKQMGFKEVHQLSFDKIVKVKSVAVECIRTKFSFFECAFKISSRTAKVLNLVDGDLTEKTLKEIIKKGPYDFCFFPFQEINQEQLVVPSSPLNIKRAYGRRIRFAAQIPVKHIGTASCDIAYKHEVWRNRKAFPIDKKRFVRDLTKLNPVINGVEIVPGVVVNIAKGKVDAEGRSAYLSKSRSKEIDCRFKEGLLIPSIQGAVRSLKQERELKRIANDFVEDFCRNSRAFKSLPNLRKKWIKGKVFHFQIVSKKNLNFYFRYKNDCIEVCPHQKPIWTFQIQDKVFIRNLTKGCPFVAALDGVRILTEFQTEKLIPNENPILAYLFPIAMIKYRMRILGWEI